MLNRAAVLMALADGPPVEYASSATTAPGASAVSKPAGLEVGDLVVVWAHGFSSPSPTLQTASGAAWAVVDNNAGVTLAGRMALFAKVMTATDVANAWNLSEAISEGAVAIRYVSHGADTVTFKSANVTGSNGNFSVSGAGFTKAAGSYGVLGLAISTTEATTIGVPAGFTQRSQVALNATIKISLSDNLYGYVDGAGATWTNFNTPALASENGRAVLLEITGP